MATANFSAPNWVHQLIAQRIGIEGSFAVEMEDDLHVGFLVHKTQKRYCVNKLTGNVIES